MRHLIFLFLLAPSIAFAGMCEDLSSFAGETMESRQNGESAQEIYKTAGTRLEKAVVKDAFMEPIVEDKTQKVQEFENQVFMLCVDKLQ